jgi:hypothetical protein
MGQYSMPTHIFFNRSVLHPDQKQETDFGFTSKTVDDHLWVSDFVFDIEKR